MLRSWLVWNCFACLVFVAAELVVLPGIASADVSSEIAELKRRIEELERQQLQQSKTIEEKTEVLAKEIDQSKLGRLLPEKADLKSEWGLGPAASSVYQVKQGISLGGYGEAHYRNFVSDAGDKKDQTDFLRLVTYVGYKFSDSIIFNSEVELEHGTTGDVGDVSGEAEGEVSVEFAYLDFLASPEFNSRVGMVLIPMGFLNEIHEPPFFHGVRRPEVEHVIIPSTWRENGFGFFGEIEASGKLEYRTYLVNGLRASRFSDSGIRDGRQKGNRALFEDVAWTGRVDYSPDFAPGFLAGAAFWLGNSGQDETFADETPSVRTVLWDAHAEYRYQGLELRALGVLGTIDDAELLSSELGKSISEEFYGWYVEAAYDVMPLLALESAHALSPFFRYEAYDTQSDVPSGFTSDDSLDKRLYTFGITYKPHPEVVLKADYRNFEMDGEKKTADEVAVGIGFAF